MEFLFHPRPGRLDRFSSQTETKPFISSFRECQSLKGFADSLAVRFENRLFKPSASDLRPGPSPAGRTCPLSTPQTPFSPTGPLVQGCER